MTSVDHRRSFEEVLRAKACGTSDLKSKERALATLSSAKRQMRRPRRLMEQICAGTVAAEELGTVLLRRIHAGCAGLGEEGRAALLRLLLHVERHADLLSTAWGSPRCGRRAGNTIVDGLVALAHHHDDWVRPVGRWKPSKRNQAHQFGELARHLLAAYEIPGFMDTVWFRGIDAESRRQQGWYRHIGAGQNIRTADVPMQMSKRMAHHFLAAPDGYTVEEALRWGQILGQKGSPDLVEAVIRTRLGRRFEDEAFWNTVLLFLIRHPELDAGRIRSVIAYIHHRKFEPQETVGPDGALVEGPAQEPNFSMKSRSLRKLIRQVERYEAGRAMEALTATAGEVDATKRRYSHFYHEEVDEDSGRALLWNIRELHTSRSLANEGEAMQHCLGSIGSKLGGKAIWSVQVRDDDAWHRVLTVSIDPVRRVLMEARGRFNANPANEFDPADQSVEGKRVSRLNATDRHLLARSHRVLHMWLDRERIAYSEDDIE